MVNVIRQRMLVGVVAVMGWRCRAATIGRPRFRHKWSNFVQKCKRSIWRRPSSRIRLTIFQREAGFTNASRRSESDESGKDRYDLESPEPGGHAACQGCQSDGPKAPVKATAKPAAKPAAKTPAKTPAKKKVPAKRT